MRPTGWQSCEREPDRVSLLSPAVTPFRTGTGVLVNKLQFSLLFHIRLTVLPFLIIHTTVPLDPPNFRTNVSPLEYDIHFVLFSWTGCCCLLTEDTPGFCGGGHWFRLSPLLDTKLAIHKSFTDTFVYRLAAPLIATWTSRKYQFQFVALSECACRVIIWLRCSVFTSQGISVCQGSFTSQD